MAPPRLERRYSADHIRQQPEFKFITSGEHEPHSRIAISLRDFEDGRTDRRSSQLKRRATVGQLVTCTDSRVTYTDSRATYADRRASVSGRDAEPPINILSKVDRRFSAVSAITRPRLSEGFCCHALSRDSVDDQTEGMSSCQTHRQTARGSMTSSTGRGRPRTCDTATPGSRATSAYDAKLEKSTTFLYGRDKSFSRTSKDLSAACPGVRSLCLHYTETNTAQNDAIIFADLLRIASYRNHVVSEAVFGLERRLYKRRADPARTTTFFDRRSSTSWFPPERTRPKTVAQKKKERKEKIKEKNEEMKLGYVPTARSLRTPGPDDMEELRRNCRYLRIDPRLQRHLYESDAGMTSPADVIPQHGRIVFKLPATHHSVTTEDGDPAYLQHVTCDGDDEIAVTREDVDGDVTGCHGDSGYREARPETGHCFHDEDADVFTSEQT